MATRASCIATALDQKERMRFIQEQVGHTTTRMIQEVGKKQNEED